MKYPIGIQTFEQIVQDGYVYVDKTALVYKLVTNGKIYFLSRPRRFGKSLLVSTLKNYFEGRKELFKELAIEQLETEWAVYPVFHLSFSGQNFMQPYELDKAIESFIADAEDTYGKGKNAESIGDRFRSVLKKAHEKTGRRAVVLIDEYDKPLLDVLDTNVSMTNGDGYGKGLEDYNRNVLKGFYGVFKDADQDLQFVLLTGVTKFSQVSVFSGFNQPDDISMDARYDAICGITSEELHSCFAGPIKELGLKFNLSEQETKERLRLQYDGYHFSCAMTDIYNPFSVLNCMSKLNFSDYWFRSGTPEYLVRLLSKSKENVNELIDKWYAPSDFVDYRADAERPLPMIYQSGYLTIKDYNIHTDSYRLDFPNREVSRGFVSVIAGGYLQTRDNSQPLSWILDLVECMNVGNTARIEKLMTSLIASTTYRMMRKDDIYETERFFQYTFYLIMKMVSTYLVLIEKEQSQGRVDCIVETNNHVYIFEFKLDGSAEQAIRQIDTCGYAREYAADSRTIHKIGVNFSSKTGTVDGFMVKL